MPLPHKTCYRSSNIVNCLGTISQLLPPLFHTRYIYFIFSLYKHPLVYIYMLFIILQTYPTHLQSTSSFIIVLGKLNVKRAQTCIGGQQNLREYLFYLQLLIGFDTLTYQKLLRSPTLVGYQDSFSGAVAGESQRVVNILVCACLLYH